MWELAHRRRQFEVIFQQSSVFVVVEDADVLKELLVRSQIRQFLVQKYQSNSPETSQSCSVEAFFLTGPIKPFKRFHLLLHFLNHLLVFITLQDRLERLLLEYLLMNDFLGNFHSLVDDVYDPCVNKIAVFVLANCTRNKCFTRRERNITTIHFRI